MAMIENYLIRIIDKKKNIFESNVLKHVHRCIIYSTIRNVYLVLTAIAKTSQYWFSGNNIPEQNPTSVYIGSKSDVYHACRSGILSQY